MTRTRPGGPPQICGLIEALSQRAQPFAIINVGYTNFTSYAYPGGMKLDVLTPQQ